MSVEIFYINTMKLFFRFYAPTKIQKSCIHAAMTSKKADIVGAAETGSGKTFAYGIPLVQEILLHKEQENTDDW